MVLLVEQIHHCSSLVLYCSHTCFQGSPMQKKNKGRLVYAKERGEGGGWGVGELEYVDVCVERGGVA